MTTQVSESFRPSRLVTRIVLGGFLAVVLFFLWTEHRAHLFGALPFVLLLLCPLMHLFMHHGQGGGRGHDQHGEGS